MKIKFRSGNYCKAVNTYNFSEVDLLHNEILETIQEVWNYGRHHGYVLNVSVGDCKVNIEKYNDHIGWWNPVENIGGKIWDCKVMSKAAWMSIWNYIMNHFGIPMSDNDLEWENINAYSEFLGEQQAKFEDILKEAEEEIRDDETMIDSYIEMEDFELIEEKAEKVYHNMGRVLSARNEFIHNMCEFTSCDWGLYDCYADVPVISTKYIYFEVDEFDINDVFEEWLNNVLPYEEKYIDLKSTLYHYFACA